MNHVFPRHTKVAPPVAAGGAGIHLLDKAGKRYIDTAVRSRPPHQYPHQGRGLRARPDGLSMGGTIDGQRGDHVLLAPPFIIEPRQIDEAVDLLGLAVDAAIAA